MTDANPPDTTLNTAARAAGPRVTEAFSVLGNETRLSILLALWEAYEPLATDNTVSFTELRERVGVAQGRQFNYHLDKVVDQFVRKTDDGYELRRAGHQLVRTVIAGTGLQDSSVDLTEIDDDCTVCGARTAITYREEVLIHRCTECEGYFGERHGQPGVLSWYEFDPAGIAGRRAEELLRAAGTTAYQNFESAIEGVCTVCSGRMEHSVEICRDHEAEGVCANCDRDPAILARFVCSVCKIHHGAPPYLLVAQHPAVISFYYDHGVALQYEVSDFERERERRQLLKAHEQTLVGEDPLRIRVDIDLDGDELHLTVDEDLQVIEVAESG